MTEGVIYKEDIENNLLSSLTSFVVGQLSSTGMNEAAIKTVLAFVVAHGLSYSISPSTIRERLTTCLIEIGQSDVVAAIIGTGSKILTG